MSKRRLSLQQRQRIVASQEKLVQRSSDLLDSLENESQSDDQQGLVIAHYGKFIDVEGQDGQCYRCNLRQNIQTIVVGDRIIFKVTPQQTAIVIAVASRTSLLWRPDFKGQAKPMAANLDQMLIVIAPHPPITPLLIDSYLVAAHFLQIKAMIVLNKTDLLPHPISAQAQVQDINLILAIYEQIGYPAIKVSTFNKSGIRELVDLLRGNTSIFVGQSGTGKSSLIHCFVPNETIAIGSMAKKSGLGMHKTTTARLYHLPHGGSIIDSPGIREFNLWHIQPNEIAKGFPEFAPYFGQCKFKDCMHIYEPECAILMAAKNGRIATSRLQSYYALCKEKS